ncbi:MAG: SRPBCC family protein [Cyclobacteriaceae bacterium]
MQSGNSVFVSRRFNCSVGELFDWLVQPRLIAQWFGPKLWSVKRVHTDIRVGGRYSIELTKPDNQNFFIEGEYSEINAPYSISFTLMYIGLSSTPPKSVVKIKLEGITPNESLLTLTQEFEHLPSDLEHRTKAWEHMLKMLSKLLHPSARQ